MLAIAILSLAPFVVPLSPSGGGCATEWVPTFGSPTGFSGPSMFTLHDDGSGVALYCAAPDHLMGVKVGTVARWNGLEFEQVGVQQPTHVLALASHDSKLFASSYDLVLGAGGVIVPAYKLSSWDGVAWSHVPLALTGPGGSGAIGPIASFDAGDGPRLYVGGTFFTINGVQARSLAKWDGTTFEPVGGVWSGVEALEVFDVGGGPKLHVGAATPRVSILDGQGAWTTLPAPDLESARAFTYFDFGGGPELVTCGVGTAGAKPVVRWDGAQWLEVGSQLGYAPDDLAIFDDGSGARLYVNAQPSGPGMARLEGSLWVATQADWGVGSVADMRVHDLGWGPVLLVGGSYQLAGGVYAAGLATYDGQDFHALATGLERGVDALLAHDDGTGESLYVGGDFRWAASTELNHVGRFDGAQWHALGNGVNGPVKALVMFDAGQGPELIAGGAFTVANGLSLAEPGAIEARGIARFDGVSWHAMGTLGTSLIGAVETLAVLDLGAGDELYAGGSFKFDGTVVANRIAKWNGSMWMPIGTGFDSTVHAIAAFDEGQGPRLFAGGSFTESGWNSVRALARWDGFEWTQVGVGFANPNSQVYALEVHDDGSGPALWVGGRFPGASGVPGSGLVRWDGSTWSSPGSLEGSPSPIVHALTRHDDGNGEVLVAGGLFTGAAGVPALNVVRWDGIAYSAVGQGQTDTVRALASIATGAAAGLYAGGDFALHNGSGDAYLGRFACAPPAIVAWPGCAGNAAVLDSTAIHAPLGQPLPLALDTAIAQDGVAVLFGGLLGVDAGGCGLPLGAMGELLLGVAPSPVLLVARPLVAHAADLSIGLPAVATLKGLEIGLQAVALDVGGAVEFSTALTVTLGG